MSGPDFDQKPAHPNVGEMEEWMQRTGGKTQVEIRARKRII
jgi:hypothetical protein